MIDIHHHLLYGLDDGPADLDTSVQMAQMAAADGITHIVCTPHASNSFVFQPEENAARLAALMQRLRDTPAAHLELGLGCDFHLSYENIQDAVANPRKYTINQKSYLLIEFASMGIAPTMPDHVFNLIDAGMKPIVTHPERNPTFVAHPRKLDDYINMGCLVQITAGSLLGAFGRAAEKFSHALLRENRVNIVSTDAHDLERRPPLLTEAFSIVAEYYGHRTARRLFVTTPLAAFQGGVPVDDAEPPETPASEENAGTPHGRPARKRGLFSRFF